MLENLNVKEQYVIASNPVFDFGVRFFSPGDIACYEYNPTTGVETELTSGTDYSVEEKTDYSSGAKVTLLGTLNAGNVLTIVRTALPIQDVSLPNFGKIPSESLETQLDRGAAVQQQLHDTVQLTMRMPYGVSSGTTPEQYMSGFVSRLIPSSGGGGGGGSSYDFNSSEFTVTSGGSVTINQIGQNKITGLTSALNAKQDKLVSGNSYSIKVNYADSAGYADGTGSALYADSAGSAGYAPYTGPFAFSGASTPYGMYYGVQNGNVYFGGSSYEVSSNTGGSTPLGVGSTLYLHLFNSGYGYEHEYVTSAPPSSSIPDGHYYTAIAKNSGGKAVQIQHGNIFLPGFTSGGSGGIGNAFVSSVSDGFVAPAPGIIFANAVLNASEAAGNEAMISTTGTDSGSWVHYGKIPQGGTTTDFNGAEIGCAATLPIESGATLHLGGSMKQTVFYMGFNVVDNGND